MSKQIAFILLHAPMVLHKKTEIELFVILKVKEMRERAGISQADLAFKLNVSLGFVGQVESSKFPAKYNLNHINELSRIFNCSPKDFLPDRAT